MGSYEIRMCSLEPPVGGLMEGRKEGDSMKKIQIRCKGPGSGEDGEEEGRDVHSGTLWAILVLACVSERGSAFLPALRGSYINPRGQDFADSDSSYTSARAHVNVSARRCVCVCSEPRSKTPLVCQK